MEAIMAAKASKPEPDLLYGYAEIGEHLGLSETQVKHLAEKDDSDFPVFNIGRRRCAKRSSIDRWIDQQEAKGRAI